MRYTAIKLLAGFSIITGAIYTAPVYAEDAPQSVEAPAIEVVPAPEAPQPSVSAEPQATESASASENAVTLAPAPDNATAEAPAAEPEVASPTPQEQPVQAPSTAESAPQPQPEAAEQAATEPTPEPTTAGEPAVHEQAEQVAPQGTPQNIEPQPQVSEQQGQVPEQPAQQQITEQPQPASEQQGQVPEQPAPQVTEQQKLPQSITAVEEEKPVVDIPPAKELSAEVRELREKIGSKFIGRLKKDKTKAASFALVTPMDFTGRNLKSDFEKSVKHTLSQFGYFKMSEITATIDNLTLEDIRRVIIRAKADILVLTILKPTAFAIYMYDKRVPYSLYGYIEAVPEGTITQFNPANVAPKANQMMMRLITEYVENRSFELPREDGKPVLDIEIPRYVASNEILTMVNREILGRNYVSIGYGTNVIKSAAGSFQSNIAAMHFGFRVHEKLFFETAVEVFSYNTWVNSVKYFFESRDFILRANAGLGVGLGTNSMAITHDSTKSFSGTNIYAVPSIALFLPLVDAYLKVESQLFVGIRRAGFIFTLMPGVMLRF